MAKRSNPAGPAPKIAQTAQGIRMGIERLTARIKELEAFDPFKMQEGRPPELMALETAIQRALEKTFGEDTADFRRFRAASELHYSRTIYISGQAPTPLSDYQQGAATKRQRALALLAEAVRTLKEDLSELEGVDTSRPFEPEIFSPPSNKIFIVHGHDEGNASPSHSRATIVASGWLHLRPHEPKSLSWFLDQLWAVGGLFALLAGKPMPPDRIELKAEPRGSILSVLVPRPSTRYCDHAEHHDFFVSRTMLGDDLLSVVVKWFELLPRVENPVSLALSIMASEELWAHVRFLSLVQALEGLHRALFSGTYMDAKQYQQVEAALVTAIPEDVSSDHRSALESRIKYGNEIALAKRLKELAELLPVPLRNRILGSSLVPRSWIDTRNYYTHWDETLRPNILSNQEMHDANVRLMGFLQASYLHLAGTNSETLQTAFAGSSEISLHLEQLNALQRK
jgi:hypothetical protein